ncbi:MAG: hypothetical protein A2Y89_07730 [Chloroflexi bacterium RBG_13_51_18]|nr:MAG: hypothetical protein A2Y89_07730 [Chloroflexi bacterium RBG_13_51_18]
MNEPLEENRKRLFALDAGLRAEADRMLEESGLGRIIKEEGFKPVGSYVMKTMTWRDLDFERCNDSPDWREHWELGLRLSKNKWVWSLHAVNAYADPRHLNDTGYYWGLRAVRPGEKEFWKLDLWTARPGEFRDAAPNRSLWERKLNEDTRYDILVIKEAVCMLPEYRQTLLSTHIYEAVLEKGVQGIDEFWEWWKKRES